MKNIKRAIWGLIFIAAAVVIALNSFNIINYDIFFDGWWTIFIIVPSFAGIITDRDKSGSILGLCFGIFLLLCARDVLEFDMIWKLLLPAIIAYIGLKMIFSSFKKDKVERIIKVIKDEGRELQNGVAVFCGTELDFDNAVFDGADLTAVFGGIDCDISNAIIDRDCVIKACAVFGGIDIKVPDTVRVVTNITSVFGDVEVKKNNPNGIHTIYLEGVCMFGGIDVK